MIKNVFPALVLFFAPLFGFADNTPNNANYFVPTAKDGSVAAANFALASFVLTTDAQNLISITFSLPEDLVGPACPPVFLTQTVPTSAGTFNLTGAGISAQCTTQATDGSQVSCTLSYTPHYLSVDPKTVTDFLNQKYSDNPAMLSEKISASTGFHGDPEGVITYNP